MHAGALWNAFCSAPFGFRPLSVSAVDFVWLTAFWIWLPMSANVDAISDGVLGAA